MDDINSLKAKLHESNLALLAAQTSLAVQPALEMQEDSEYEEENDEIASSQDLFLTQISQRR